MAKNRNYSYKDVDMLMASKTIAESFRANIAKSNPSPQIMQIFTDKHR